MAVYKDLKETTKTVNQFAEETDYDLEKEEEKIALLSEQNQKNHTILERAKQHLEKREP